MLSCEQSTAVRRRSATAGRVRAVAHGSKEAPPSSHSVLEHEARKLVYARRYELTHALAELSCLPARLAACLASDISALKSDVAAAEAALAQLGQRQAAAEDKRAVDVNECAPDPHLTPPLSHLTVSDPSSSSQDLRQNSQRHTQRGEVCSTQRQPELPHGAMPPRERVPLR